MPDKTLHSDPATNDTAEVSGSQPHEAGMPFILEPKPIPPPPENKRSAAQEKQAKEKEEASQSPFSVIVGQVYDGPTGSDGNDDGGYLNSAVDEYAVWTREHFTRGIQPPVRAELDTLRALRQTPDGVFVEILGSTGRYGRPVYLGLHPISAAIVGRIKKKLKGESAFTEAQVLVA